MISQELLDELGTIMKEDYGIVIEKEDLLSFADMLVTFFQILSKVDGGQVA